MRELPLLIAPGKLRSKLLGENMNPSSRIIAPGRGTKIDLFRGDRIPHPNPEKAEAGWKLLRQPRIWICEICGEREQTYGALEEQTDPDDLLVIGNLKGKVFRPPLPKGWQASFVVPNSRWPYDFLNDLLSGTPIERAVEQFHDLNEKYERIVCEKLSCKFKVWLKQQREINEIWKRPFPGIKGLKSKLRSLINQIE